MTASIPGLRLFFLCLFLASQSIFSGFSFVNGATQSNISRPWTPSDGHLAENGDGPNDSPPAPPTEVDAIIVGGGFSGLMAAYELQQAGYKTLVLEAKHRIGGKSYSQRVKNGTGVIELGATWINNDTQPEVFSLSEKFGLETVEQYLEGDGVFQGVDGVIRRTSSGGDDEDVGLEDNIAEFLQGALFLIISESANKIDVRDFESFPEKSDVSFADFIAQWKMWDIPHLQGITRGLTRSIVGREPEDVGAHYFLDYIKSGYGLESLMSQDSSGAQYLWIKQGTSSIANGLAEAMTPGSVLINTPVKKIAQGQDNSVVTTEAGESFRAKKVILAATQNVWSNIEFSPPLPEAKQELVENTKPGVYAKMIVTYTEPWWRDAGFVGEFTSLTGPVCFSWEISDPVQDFYCLALFVAGDIAAEWHRLSHEERERTMVEHVAELVGEEHADKARDVKEIEYIEWTKESYILGGPTSGMEAGMLRKHGAALREPFKDLHFAGTETAYEWKGYLEGAITAGQRAAKEVIEALGGAGEE